MGDDAKNGDKRRPSGRTLADFRPLGALEESLVDGCAKGQPLIVKADGRPGAPPDGQTIRAALVRFLALGGDDTAPVHEQGVQIQGAWIEGDLNLEACQIARSLVLTSCHLDGRLVLFRAEVPDLYLDGTSVDRIFADGLQCRGDAFLRHGFHARNGIRLPGASIGGNLELIGSRVDCPEGDALQCERTKIGGDVQLANGFEAHGMVSFRDARIGANVSCEGGFFEKVREFEKSKEFPYALAFDAAKIEGNLFLSHQFRAEGAVRLISASVGGDFVCAGGQFDGDGDFALSFDDAKISGNVILNDGFCAKGTVRFLRAQIGSDLVCENASFAPSDQISLALNLADVRRRMFFRKVSSGLGQINLRDARVGELIDDFLSWQSASALELQGFQYDAIEGDVAHRLVWLDKQVQPKGTVTFPFKPWEQLARTFSLVGRKSDAIRVRIDMRDRQWRNRWANQGGVWRRTMAFLPALPEKIYGLSFGYGYRLARGMTLSIVICWLIGGLVYHAVAPLGIMAPTDPKIYLEPKMPPECRIDWVNFAGPQMPRANEIASASETTREKLLKVIADDQARREEEAARAGLSRSSNWNWKTICNRFMPSEYTHFQPYLYSLDVTLPIVNLRQTRDWSPRVFGENGAPIHPITSVFGLGHIVRLWEMFQTIAGWVLLSLLAAAVTGFVKKDPANS